MSTDRVNELRQILRANRPETPDLTQPVREAKARQDAALLTNREPDSVQLAAAVVDEGLDRLFRRIGPPADEK